MQLYAFMRLDTNSVSLSALLFPRNFVTINLDASNVIFSLQTSVCSNSLSWRSCLIWGPMKTPSFILALLNPGNFVASVFFHGLDKVLH